MFAPQRRRRRFRVVGFAGLVLDHVVGVAVGLVDDILVVLVVDLVFVDLVVGGSFVGVGPVVSLALSASSSISWSLISSSLALSSASWPSAS